MDDAMKYEMVKQYLEGALSIELESDFGRAYLQGLRSLQGYIRQLDNHPQAQKDRLRDDLRPCF